MLSCHDARTLDYPTMNLNPCWTATYDHNACPSQTDRQTDWRTSWQWLTVNLSHGQFVPWSTCHKVNSSHGRLITKSTHHTTYSTHHRVENKVTKII